MNKDIKVAKTEFNEDPFNEFRGIELTNEEFNEVEAKEIMEGIPTPIPSHLSWREITDPNFSKIIKLLR